MELTLAPSHSGKGNSVTSQSTVAVFLNGYIAYSQHTRPQHDF